jgi:DNA-binding winged helix-turn-helix (wHTH) protein
MQALRHLPGSAQPAAAVPFVATDVIAFGGFRLNPFMRLLEKAGTKVRIGSRAFDILILLVEHAGEIISKKDILATVWPDSTVDEASLRVGMAVLRKALGEGHPDGRFIINIPGRGYSFVHPIFRSTVAISSTFSGSLQQSQDSNLPGSRKRLPGWDDSIQAILWRLTMTRFLNLLGPRGSGKTAKAIEVGHAHLTAFGGCAWFVNLELLADAGRARCAIASALGLSGPDPDPGAFLSDRRGILILDGCDCVAEEVAEWVDRLRARASPLTVLTTSREPLPFSEQHNYPLGPRLSLADGDRDPVYYIPAFSDIRASSPRLD